VLNTADWKTKTLKVTSIRLDEQNIRLENASPSQDAIIQDLFTNYSTFDLVKSILQFGLFNHELPIVVEQGKKCVVLEGNRRVAALKVIINPKLVPKYEKNIKELVKAAGNISTLQNIEVKVADSRDTASRVIATIHTVRSRIPWRPLRQAYFYFAQIESGKKTLNKLRSEYQDVDIPRFVRMWEMHSIAKSIVYDSKETQSKVNSRNFPISTFERVYSNEAFKKKAGLIFDENGSVTVETKKDEFQILIKRVVTDIADKNIDSRLLNRMDSKAAQEYLNSLGTPNKSGKKGVSVENFPVATPAAQRRTKLIPGDIECSLKYPAVIKMFNELKKIPYGKYPNATHDLLRSFLECSLKAYFESLGMTPARNLSGLIPQAIAHFQVEKKALVQPLQAIQGQKNYLYSRDFLDAVNHNHHIFSIGENVENAWDQMQPVLIYILNPPNKNDSNKNP